MSHRIFCASIAEGAGRPRGKGWFKSRDAAHWRGGVTVLYNISRHYELGECGVGGGGCFSGAVNRKIFW